MKGVKKMDTEKFMGEIQRAIKNSDPKMTENEISSELLYHLKVDGNDRNNIERLISHAILNGPAQVTSVAIATDWAVRANRPVSGAKRQCQ